MATEASTSTSTTVVASSAGGSRVPDPSVSAASTLDVQSVVRAVLGEVLPSLGTTSGQRPTQGGKWYGCKACIILPDNWDDWGNPPT